MRYPRLSVVLLVLVLLLMAAECSNAMSTAPRPDKPAPTVILAPIPAPQVINEIKPEVPPPIVQIPIPVAPPVIVKVEPAPAPPPVPVKVQPAPAPKVALTDADRKMLARAEPYFPLLREAFDAVWPDAPMKSVIPAQIQKESFWNPNAELCVPKPTCSRERGIGLTQFTITSRFNVFNEVKHLHPVLKDWGPDTYKDPRRQLYGIVAKDRQHFKQCAPLMESAYDAMACTVSSYNGGFGGFSADRKLCSNTKGCNPQKWFGHVENTSLKAKVALQGYGQSFFQINRGYVVQTLINMRAKFFPYFGS